MPSVVIPDTSALILFQNIEEIDLLKKVYGELVTTPEVEEEFIEGLPDWIKIQPVSDKKYQEFFETQIDKGEASVIALATEYSDVLLLLDDLKARKLAGQLNMKITGTLGVIHKAKQMKIIDKVKPLIDKLLQTDFRISEKIVQEILQLNGE